MILLLTASASLIWILSKSGRHPLLFHSQHLNKLLKLGHSFSIFFNQITFFSSFMFQLTCSSRKPSLNVLPPLTTSKAGFDVPPVCFCNNYQREFRWSVNKSFSFSNKLLIAKLEAISLFCSQHRGSSRHSINNSGI